MSGAAPRQNRRVRHPAPARPPKDTNPPAPPEKLPAPKPAVNAGARPVSPRQRAQNAVSANSVGRSDTYLRAYRDSRVLILSPARDPKAVSEQRVIRKRNRRRASARRLLRGLLNLSLLVLIIECGFALLYSPRLWVANIAVAGNSLLPTERVIERLNLPNHENLLRLPLPPLRHALEAEPAVSHVELRRVFPNTLQVVIQERTAIFCVQSGGTFYTLDNRFIPFQSLPVPARGLPLLKVQTRVVPGKVFDAPGLTDASRCLEWAAAHAEFPLDSITIDPTGKLCLNRSGGMLVEVGSGLELSRKLHTLAMLLALRTDLRDGSGAVRINLFASDAPAILSRVVHTDSTPPANPGSVVR